MYQPYYTLEKCNNELARARYFCSFALPVLMCVVRRPMYKKNQDQPVVSRIDVLYPMKELQRVRLRKMMILIHVQPARK